MKIKKRTLWLVSLAGLLGLLAVGSTAAYLTDYDQAENEFTVGKVDIDLEEPHWNPDDNKKTEPGDEIPKDPQVQNTGVNDAFVYLEISVPAAEVITADEDGRRQERKVRELFTFVKDEGWTELNTAVSGDYRVHTFAYNAVLKPGETTSALFEKVVFLNVIEGQLDGVQVEIPVRAYAIQSAHTGGEETDVVEQARKAYEKYVNQNVAAGGAVTKTSGSTYEGSERE